MDDDMPELMVEAEAKYREEKKISKAEQADQTEAMVRLTT
jgi:hypothetical protein